MNTINHIQFDEMLRFGTVDGGKVPSPDQIKQLCKEVLDLADKVGMFRELMDDEGN